jgi:hypothetical protein
MKKTPVSQPISAQIAGFVTLYCTSAGNFQK